MARRRPRRTRGPRHRRTNPDLQTPVTSNPPSYEAIRTQDFLYVEYKNGQRELYDLRTDPSELHNIIPNVSRPTRTMLHVRLSALDRCHTGNDCWTAEHVDAVARSLLHRRARHRRAPQLRWIS